MRRREFITLLGGAVAAGPIAARAQQDSKSWRIGFLTPRSRPSPPDRDTFSDAFMQGMSDLGYSEGKNLAVEWRYADGDYKRLTGFATELAGMNLPVIVTYGTAAARVLQGTTKTIPIVVAAADDLVGAGIVASLARPGGNITGLSLIDADISGKQLELLKAISPTLSRVAVLLNPGNPANPAVLKHVQAVAPALNVEVVAVNAATPQAIEDAFADAAQQRAGAVIVAADAFFSGQGPRIATSALQHRLATISLYQDHVVAGWLKRAHPEGGCYQVSHETIYRSLFVQARGVLKKELLCHLRSKRTIRRSKQAGLNGDGRGQIKDLISIRQRPAAVEDRAVPGHWEGDLLSGSNNSYIATLVERHTRYVMLAKVANKDTQSVVSALIKQAKKLPSELYKSLTWDRGKELADHRKFTLATNIEVYFCDPQSPWQRGSNENTNGLLRQYFPKGTDLSVHSQAYLNKVARQLNERPRETLQFETPAERFNACVASIN